MEKEVPIVADKKNNNYRSVNITADIVNLMSNDGNNETEQTTSSSNSNKYGQDVELLKSIDSTLKSILREGATMSQSDARNAIPSRKYGPRTGYSNDSKWDNARTSSISRKGKRTAYKSDGTEFEGVVKEFSAGLRSQLMEGLFGENIKESIQNSLKAFEKEFNVSLTDLPKHIGKDVGKWITGQLKKTEVYNTAKQKASGLKDRGLKYAEGKFREGLSNYDQSKGKGSKATDAWDAFVKSQREKQPDDEKQKANNQDKKSSKFSPDNLSQQSGKQYGYDTLSDIISGDGMGAMDQYMTALLESIAENVSQITDVVIQPKKDEYNKHMDELRAKNPNVSDDLLNKLAEKHGYKNYQSDLSPLQEMINTKRDAFEMRDIAMKKAAEHVQQGPLTDIAMDGGLDAITAGLKSVGMGIVEDFGPKLLSLGTKVIPEVLVATLALKVGMKLLDLATRDVRKSFQDLKEATSNYLSNMKKSANRDSESRKKNLELAQERILADTKTLIEEPFNILKQAAEEWYDVWDNQLRTINGTQGYSKDDLYELIGNYAERLRSENLTSVVSSADITTNLAKVLESGLSGQVAEEFAYLATKLNAAIPTQDFFNYAETYASLAANAIKNGKSQSQAIAYANSELESFASNILYASRELSGGFSTGLKDAQSLFQSSVEIATASRTGEASTISGVLTSVAAIVGAIAPDLSTSIVDAVVDAAVGGNSEEIVALRSLAGINASNTEFLKAIANNAQSVFVELFSNLGKMQNMSQDAYMEVAEGVAEIFGLQKEALQRVDFNYLATAISKMNVNNKSLDENMSLLVSGQTTSTTEQLKMAQINQYMIDEGLEYVLDNAAARSIQEHMWDEQIARELMEATYGVELQGSALTFLERIQSVVEKITQILNPFSYFKRAGNLVETNLEYAAQRSDLEQFLELGKVGTGGSKTLRNLTTTNRDLSLTKSMVNLMGGLSAYGGVSGVRTFGSDLTSGLSGSLIWGQSSSLWGQSNLNYKVKNTLLGIIDNALDVSKDAVQDLVRGKSDSVSNISASRYNWGTVSKSVSSFVTGVPGPTYLSNSTLAKDASTTSVVEANTNKRFKDFINSLDKFMENNPEKTYDDWKATATKYGIKDFDQALEDYGQTEAGLQGYWDRKEGETLAKEAARRNEIEENAWNKTIQFVDTDHPEWREVMSEYMTECIANQEEQTTLMTTYFKMISDNQVTQIELQEYGNKVADKIYSKEQQFYNQWVDYYVKHTAYKSAFSSYDVNVVKQAEKKSGEDSVLALAKALTGNVDKLSDPAVQTNVLLSQILIVAEAIMQQNNSVGGVLPTALASLGLGITDK